MSSTYLDLVEGVRQYYGAGSDQWLQIAQYGITPETIPIIEQVPGVSITVSESGKFLGYDYLNPFQSATNPVSIIDSNVQTGSYGVGSFNAQLPATSITDSSTGLTTLESGAKSVSSGVTVATIADKCSLALIGVSVGTKLGKAIDSTLYSVNPNWWDEHYPTINPNTWDDMVSTSLGKSVMRGLFAIEDDTATMYVDERMLAYTYMMLLENGAYGQGTPRIEKPTIPDVDFSGFPATIPLTTQAYRRYVNPYSNQAYRVYAEDNTETVYVVPVRELNGGSKVYCVSTAPFTLVQETVNPVTGVVINTSRAYVPMASGGITYGTRTPYAISVTGAVDYQYINVSESIPLYVLLSYYTERLLATYLIDGTEITPSTVDGITDNPDAGEHVNPDTLINPTTGQPVTPNDNVDDVLDALKTQYPSLFNNEIYEDVPQPTGIIDRIKYIPVPYPNTTIEDKPVTDPKPGVDPQTDPQIDPDTDTPERLQDIVDTLVTDPTPPDTGDGDTPPPILPSGSASALYSIYNPSQGEINSFGAWLWSSNFVDQLLKLFNDPMQAIIGLHKVFAPPSVSSRSNIKVGYLDSGVPSNVVGSQYTSIDCGTVYVNEFFGNPLDYDPHTNIYIYLPFIGIEKLNTSDIMRSSVNVVYHVDVLTGACLAEINVVRDGCGGILYSYSGNCAVQYPVSSGSYMGIVATIASIAGGVVGTVASGGALAPVAMGALGGALNAHTRVQHSGGFSGNAGAMGVRNPYLIIVRPQSCIANNFQNYQGYPANEFVRIGDCNGFVRCKAVHLDNINATDSELAEIESLLKSGVIV